VLAEHGVGPPPQVGQPGLEYSSTIPAILAAAAAARPTVIQAEGS
jgi:hypothetical protein